MSVVTAVIDSYGPKEWILPGMGLHNCFLSGRAKSYNSYLMNPHFIYYKVFLIILSIVNWVYFIKVVAYLIKHWAAIKHLNMTSNSRVLERISLVARCFFIMGVPMVFIIIADLLRFELGKRDPAIQYLYIASVFAGVYMFVALICKKSVLQALKARATNINTTITSLSSQS